MVLFLAMGIFFALTSNCKNFKIGA